MRKKIVLLTILLISLYSCQTRITEVEYEDSSVDDYQADEESAIEPAIDSKVYEELSIKICDTGKKNANELSAFFMISNPDADEQKVLRLAELYVYESAQEGVNSDVAFVQMCLETGFLRFGGLVSESMNNFCGLGAMSETQRGLVFETEQLGVRAHVQHLHAYGCILPLQNELIDTRYKYVNPRGKAPTIFELAGTWASDKLYGTKLQDLLVRLAYF